MAPGEVLASSNAQDCCSPSVENRPRRNASFGVVLIVVVDAPQSPDPDDSLECAL